jgi:hypothetical protein
VGLCGVLAGWSLPGGHNPDLVGGGAAEQPVSRAVVREALRRAGGRVAATSPTSVPGVQSVTLDDRHGVHVRWLVYAFSGPRTASSQPLRGIIEVFSLGSSGEAANYATRVRPPTPAQADAMTLDASFRNLVIVVGGRPKTIVPAELSRVVERWACRVCRGRPHADVGPRLASAERLDAVGLQRGDHLGDLSDLLFVERLVERGHAGALVMRAVGDPDLQRRLVGSEHAGPVR